MRLLDIHRPYRTLSLSLIGAAFILAPLHFSAAETGTNNFPGPNAVAVKFNNGEPLPKGPEPRIFAWDVTWKKGEATPLLSHTLDELVVTLDEGAVRFTDAKGQSHIEYARHGDVKFVPRGRTESEEGVSDKPQRAIIVQFRDNMPPVVPLAKIPGAAPQFPRAGAVKLFETDKFIVWDQLANWPSTQRSVLHAHYNPSAEINIEPGSARGFDKNGKPTGSPEGSSFAPGFVAYAESRKEPHSEEMVGASPARFIFIEFIK